MEDIREQESEWEVITAIDDLEKVEASPGGKEMDPPGRGD